MDMIRFVVLCCKTRVRDVGVLRGQALSPENFLFFRGNATFSCTFIRTWLRYVRLFVFAVANPSVVCLSVVCNVRAPYSGGNWNFRQYFVAILYLSHTLTFVQNFTEIALGELLRRDIKRKRGSKIERCHVRVSHLLMSFLSYTVELSLSL